MEKSSICYLSRSWRNLWIDLQISVKSLIIRKVRKFFTKVMLNITRPLTTLKWAQELAQRRCWEFFLTRHSTSIQRTTKGLFALFYRMQRVLNLQWRTNEKEPKEDGGMPQVWMEKPWGGGILPQMRLKNSKSGGTSPSRRTSVPSHCWFPLCDPLSSLQPLRTRICPLSTIVLHLWHPRTVHRLRSASKKGWKMGKDPPFFCNGCSRVCRNIQAVPHRPHVERRNKGNIQPSVDNLLDNCFEAMAGQTSPLSICSLHIC